MKEKEVSEGKTLEEDEGKKEPDIINSVSFSRLFHFADKIDFLLMFFGTLGAAGNGVSQPISFIIFGKLIEKFIQFGASKYQTKSTLTPNANASSGITLPPNFLNDEMKTFAIFYVGLGVGMFVCAFLQAACWSHTANRQVHKIRKKFFHSVMKQDIGWFDIIESNSLSSRLSDDLVKIQGGIGSKVGIVIQSLCMFIGGFVVGFVYSWKLTLVILAVVPLLAAVGALFGKVMANLSSEEQNAYAAAGNVANEVISSIRTVIAFGGEQEEIERYSSNLKEAEKAGLKKASLLGASMGLLYIVMFGSYALGFWYGATLVADGDISGGEMLIVFFSVMVGGFQIGQLAPNFEGINTARGAAYFIYDVCEKEPVINCLSDEGKVQEKIAGDISFKDVNFYYPSRKDMQILNSFNLDIKNGSTIALVGESGCGKSTIVKLVQRFYDPDSGNVSLDGHDLRDLNLKWLRSNIGVVSQEPVLFELSIAENIKLGEADHATQEDIENAAKNANAHDFIMSLPQKYDTYVGEGGAQLSGGQKQRIAIARALVRDPKILLFDEATSALDTESEAIVQAALDKASEGRTTIIIAHRLSTVKNADKIIAVKGGSVAEMGTHEELMAKKGFYYQLVLLQTMVETELSDEEDEDILEETEEIIRSKLLRTLSSLSSGSKEEDIEIVNKLSHQLSSQRSLRKSFRKKKKKEQKKKSKNEEDEDEKIEPASYLRILSISASEWPYFLVGSIFSAVIGVFPLCFAIILSELLEEFSFQSTIREKSVKYALYFLLLGFCEGVSFFIASILFGKAGEILTKRLRTQTFAALVRQDVSYFDEPINSTGKVGARLSSDASKIQGATSARFNIIVQVFTMGVSALIVAFYYSWKLTLVILAFVPLLLIAGAAQIKVFTNLSSDQAKNFVSANAVATQAIMNIRTVASLGKEVYFITKFGSLIDGPYRGTKKSSLVFGVSFGLSFSIMMLANAASFVLGGKLVQEETLNFGDMFKVVLATMFAALTAGQVASMAPDFIEAKISASRVFKIIDRRPPIDSFSDEGDKLENVKGNIEFESINFHYPTRPGIKVLDGLSLKIKAGQKVALVGSSGCGKSTSIGLLERFYDPLEGSISLDDRNTKELNIKWLRSVLGLVSQEPVLFARTIKDNICYGVKDQFSEEDIENAARNANIHSFISSLPRGYDTMVGEKGTLISGGQKQRIAIARALIRNPKVMLLDEATSALDSESEKVVQDALDTAMEGRTSIIIAHRLSTIQNADLIVVIQHGKIAEMGTHQELIAKQGAYYLLNSAQM